MGILRTDKISGLETPTAVTGSVCLMEMNYLDLKQVLFCIWDGRFYNEGWFYSFV